MNCCGWCSWHARVMPAELIALMLKQLPPSASELTLLDVGGHCSAQFTAQRRDLNSRSVQSLPTEASDADAIVALDQPLTADFLTAAHASLRPGGRLIIGWRHGSPTAQQQLTLEGAGFVRILIEVQGEALLLRGERPHDTESPLERIRQVADGDVVTDLASWPGRYVHLLVRQTPERPPWALREGETLRWQALTVGAGAGQKLLAFSSLPRAVAFLQPAVLQGSVRDVNKVGKFTCETARSWPLGLLLNPGSDVLAQDVTGMVDMDPATAAASDE